MSGRGQWLEICDDPSCPDYGVHVRDDPAKLWAAPTFCSKPAETGYRPVSRQVRRQRQREARKRSR
jgi:hypothetical protein